jgi:hypothetical protein
VSDEHKFYEGSVYGHKARNSRAAALRRLRKDRPDLHERVQFILKFACNNRLVPVHCTECSTVITQLHGVADNNRTVGCLTCLGKRPGATFGQRLKAHRLAAGLTLTALEQHSGVHLSLISDYECGRREPKWQTLAKLIRVLGVEWLAVK